MMKDEQAHALCRSAQICIILTSERRHQVSDELRCGEGGSTAKPCVACKPGLNRGWDSGTPEDDGMDVA